MAKKRAPAEKLDEKIKAILEQEKVVKRQLDDVHRKRLQLQKAYQKLLTKRTLLAARKLVGQQVVLKGHLGDESNSQIWRRVGRMTKVTKGNHCLVDFGQHGTHELHLLDVMAEDRYLWQKLIAGG